MDIEQKNRELLESQRDNIRKSLLGLSDDVQDEIIKAKRAQVGEVRKWAGGSFRKTENGWEPVKEGIEKPKAMEEGSDEQKPQDITEAAKNASESALQNAIKVSNDPKVREAAHRELERRKNEEATNTFKAPEDGEGKKGNEESNNKVETEKKDETKQENKKEESISDKDKDMLDKFKKLSPEAQKRVLEEMTNPEPKKNDLPDEVNKLLDKMSPEERKKVLERAAGGEKKEESDNKEKIKPVGKKLNTVSETYSWGNLVKVENGNSWRAVFFPEDMDKIKKLDEGKSVFIEDEQGHQWNVTNNGDGFNIEGVGRTSSNYKGNFKLEDIKEEKGRTSDDTKTEKLSPMAENFLDKVKIFDNKIKFEDLTVEATPKGNWTVYNKGKRLGVMDSKLLNEETIRKYNLEHHDTEDTDNENNSKSELRKSLLLQNIEDKDLIEKSHINEFVYNKDMEISKTGKELKEKFGDMLKEEISDVRELSIKINDKVEEIGEQPTKKVKDIWSWKIDGWEDKLPILPNIYNEEYIVGVKPDKDKCGYDQLVSRLIDCSIEVIMLNTMIENMKDSKEYKLTVRQASMLGF